MLAGPPEVTIELDGEAVPARAGESLAATLVAAGILTCRESRTGAARGVWCGMGVCSECAMSIDGVAGRLACMEPVRPGMSVRRNPARRSLHASPTPAGGAPDGGDGRRGGEEVVRCDVLVLGSGPAGLSAALAARRAGADVVVVVVDERRGAGGQYFKQPAFEVDEARLDAQYRAGRALLDEVRHSGARLLNGVRVWGHDGPAVLFGAALPGSHDDRRYELRSRALILATGAYERAVPFPGWTLPGVMTTGAAQTLLRSYLVAAGQRVLVSGNGPLNLQVAAELVQAGVEVAAVAELARPYRREALAATARMAAAEPRLVLAGGRYLAVLRRAGVPVLTGAAVVGAEGPGRVAAATVARLDAAGWPLRRGRRSFVVDAVCLGFGFVPSSEIARSLGCGAGLDPASGAPVVERDVRGRTSVAGVWIAGDGASIGGAELARAAGTLAGLDAARSLGLAPSREGGDIQRRAEKLLARSGRFQHGLWQLYRAPRLVEQLATPETIVCRCEDVAYGELEQACDPWLAAAGPLKRVTRAGMGKCQGRYCSAVVTELAARRGRVGRGAALGFPAAGAVPAGADRPDRRRGAHRGSSRRRCRARPVGLSPEDRISRPSRSARWSRRALARCARRRRAAEGAGRARAPRA